MTQRVEHKEYKMPDGPRPQFQENVSVFFVQAVKEERG